MKKYVIHGNKLYEFSLDRYRVYLSHVARSYYPRIEEFAECVQDHIHHYDNLPVNEAAQKLAATFEGIKT